ncbi:aminotransferase class IV [Cellulomonas sp. HZM]|uniref:aminotransferase class IV n=1 Tax=Cellulomonas sp. HZM TaxID=1454010 RepID=UPI0004931924|nr:aminotransferase class IV [Cellulomonas sp. HZM]
MSVVIWSAGRLHAADDLVVRGVDHGLTVGDGAFETCAVYGGRAFALTRHLARLGRSARGLGLPEPDEDEVRTAVDAVLGALPDAGRLRVTYTGGPGPLGSNRLAPDEQRPTVLVLAGPAVRSETSRAVRVPWVRNERSAVAGLKTTSYAENVVALARAQEQGADEAVLANTVGRLCEGTASNVLVERDGRLVTPPLSSGCLAGITRELVLEWGADAGLPVAEEDLAYDVLDEVVAGAAHLTLTGSIRNVSPVVRLDGTEVAAGELSLEVQRLFEQRAALDVDP